jgi:hypothetical protein
VVGKFLVYIDDVCGLYEIFENLLSFDKLNKVSEISLFFKSYDVKSSSCKLIVMPQTIQSHPPHDVIFKFFSVSLVGKLSQINKYFSHPFLLKLQ